MNFTKSKATTIIITIVMLTSIAAMAIPAQAQVQEHGGSPGGGYEGPTTIPAGQTADFTISSLAFLSVSPNPVGVGQQLLVNVWTTFPSGEGKYQVGYKVTITKPDGTTEDVNLKSYVADGTAWFTYVPTTVGQYKFVFNFAGEYFPAGYYISGQYSTTRTGFFAGAIYNPSVYVSPATSNTVVITVQNDLVMSWQSPLPTDLWKRPIEPNNREWYAIGGNYPWVYRIGGENAWSDGYYGPFIKAPDTPHILWKRQAAMAGLIGGEAYQYPASGNPGTPSVIYQGRAYQTMTVPINGIPTSAAASYDLRTGEQYYAIPTAQGGITPTHIAYWYPTATGATGTVPGSEASSGVTVDLLALSGSGNNMRLYKINPATGAVTANVSLPNLGNLEYFYRDGYVLSFAPYRSINTTDPSSNITVTKANTGWLVNWSARGSSTNFTSRIVSNISVTIPLSYRTLYQIGSYGDLGAYDPDSGITINQNRFIYGGYYGSSLEAVDLVSGQSLWNWTSDVNVMESAYRPTNAWHRHGIYVAEMERGYLKAWDGRTGKVLWESHIPDLPWGEFWMYDEAAYQDVLFGVGYTGVWAIRETTGEIVWHYVDPAVPFETPYTSGNGTLASYSVQNIRIADGKIYVQNSEHSPSYPSTRGWGLTALNVTTGQKLWKISGTAMGPGPAADGYMVSASSYDGYIYVLGKGPSKTTVTAPTTMVANGTTLLIQGSVLDMSPAQPNTPAVADESMSTWMDYLQLQMPIDGIYHNETIKGVKVMLVATDSNMNSKTIGTAITDSSGNFIFPWTPTLASTYTITAIFSGSGSYGSSTATTGLSVGTVQSTSSGGSQQPVSQVQDNTTLLYVILVAVVVAIILSLIAIFRKH